MLSNFSNRKVDKDNSPIGVTPTGPAGAAIPLPSGAKRNRPGERMSPSVIGADLVILGNLVSSGQVQVDGEVQGDIHGTHVVVGEGARITGAIVSEEVVVRGTVMGSIRSMKVMLQAESKVEGDIYHQTLAIEQGAYFEGKSRRTENPLAGAERPILDPGA